MKAEERKLWEKEQRKARIGDIAEQLFFEKGIGETTIEDIARAAGYNKRTLYLYFKDKEELILTLVYRGQRLFKEALETAIRETPPEKSMLLNIGRACYQYSIRHPEYLELIMRYESKSHLYYDAPQRENDAGCRRQCQQISDTYEHLVLSAISRDLQAGHLQSSLQPRQLMLLLWGQLFGVLQILLMRRHQFEETYKITSEELFEAFLGTTFSALQSSR